MVYFSSKQTCSSPAIHLQDNDMRPTHQGLQACPVDVLEIGSVVAVLKVALGEAQLA